MSTCFDLDRRRFIKGVAVSGALVLGTRLLTAESSADNAMPRSSDDSEVNLFVALQSDGTVDITCHRSEMGQHIRTAVAQVIADEMEADWNKIRLIQAQGDKRYGDQNTDGSKSIRLNLQRLRIVGATVKTMLEHAAARQWEIDPQQCRAEQHQVIASNGNRLAYGALANQLTGVEPPGPDGIKLKTRSQWRYVGKSQPIVDMADIVTGRAQYAADIRLDDTVVAVIARPPVVLATPESWDTEAAMAVPGVLQVIRMPDLQSNPVKYTPLGGVAVLAQNTWAALRGRDKLNVQWSGSPNQSYDSSLFRRELEDQNEQPGEVRRNIGDIDRGLREAGQTLSAKYYVPLLSHAPMEPPAATARMSKESLVVWACTQNPQADLAAVADYMGMKESQVTVNVTLLGGAFGRKSKPDFSAEAAWLARASDRTVRVQWSREDDIRHDFYHTVSAQRLDGGLDKSGRLSALRHRSTFPTIASTFTAGARRPGGETSQGLVNAPLQIPNLRVETGEVDAHVRIGWMRSVANIYHCFALQSFLAELAEKGGRDHREFLLESIGADRHIDFAGEGTKYSNHGEDIKRYPYDTARLKHVLHLATDKAKWGRKLEPGHGLGLAVHRSFLTYVATVVEVAISAEGVLRIPGVWVAVDAGTVVNIDSVVNQMQGGSLFALSFALHSSITAKAGAIEQSNYHDYKVARMQDAPSFIDVQVVESDAAPAGVGEPGTPPFAPALCNAIDNAVGVRIRELPIAEQLTSSMKAARNT